MSGPDRRDHRDLRGHPCAERGDLPRPVCPHLRYEHLGRSSEMLIDRPGQARSVVVALRARDGVACCTDEVGDVTLCRGLPVGPGHGDDDRPHLLEAPSRLPNELARHEVLDRSHNGECEIKDGGAADRHGGGRTSQSGNGGSGEQEDQFERSEQDRQAREPAGPHEPRRPPAYAEAPRAQASHGSRNDGQRRHDGTSHDAGERREAQSELDRRAHPPPQGKARRRACEVVLSLGYSQPPKGGERRPGDRYDEAGDSQRRHGRRRSTAARSSPGALAGVIWPTPSHTTRWASCGSAD